MNLKRNNRFLHKPDQRKPVLGGAKLLAAESEQDSFPISMRSPLQGPNPDLSSFTSAGGPLPSRTLSNESNIINLGDEAPAPEPASAAGFIRRPNRHGGEVVLSPLTTVQPRNRTAA